MDGKAKISIFAGCLFTVMILVGLVYNMNLESIVAAFESKQEFTPSERYNYNPVTELRVEVKNKVSNKDVEVLLLVSGGKPPYEYRIGWGDARSDLHYSQDPFRRVLTHSYDTSGERLLFLDAWDSVGHNVHKESSIRIEERTVQLETKKPDLVIDSVTFVRHGIDIERIEGDRFLLGIVCLEVKVRNGGDVPAGNLEVLWKFDWEGPGKRDGEVSGEREIHIASVGSNSSAIGETVNCPVLKSGGVWNMQVILDPNNRISESHKTNNVWVKRIWIVGE